MFFEETSVPGSLWTWSGKAAVLRSAAPQLYRSLIIRELTDTEASLETDLKGFLYLFGKQRKQFTCET